tara:strand:+ start:1086 stop:1886 length:801 start_codon:yes stop_codon:yes gene_type:complete
MRSNSPFLNHNIEHLSVSKINAWISNPASVLYSMAGGTDDFGPSAWRGKAVEEGFEKLMLSKNLSVEQVIQIAESSFDNLIKWDGFTDEKINKERKTIPDYVKAGYNHFSKLGEPTSCQKRIFYEFDELEIPFIGYIDFEFGKQGDFYHCIRDCKTSQFSLNNIKDSFGRQLALYGASAGTDMTELWIDNVTRKSVQNLKLENPKMYLENIVRVALGFRKFLSISSDIEELLSMIQPDLDDWRWANSKTKKQAKQIWRLDYDAEQY